jgi:hypothetical protein
MSRFALGASFAVVAQKDGSFAVEVHEPRRVVPLRITGYASEAEAKAAIAGFTATESLERPRDPVTLTDPVGDIATRQVADAIEGKRDPSAVAMRQTGGKARATAPSRKQRAGIAKKAAAARRKK